MLLPEHSSNEDICRRFRREGRFANSVQHPGAVSVIDDDVSDDGAAFLVLELLHGVTCDELCSRCGGRLPLDAACAIGLQVLDVLQAAHDHGIIHRDIKPSNLFILHDGAVKVLDFGIARVRQTAVGGGHVTKTGTLLGTPAFMAPEQAIGAGMTVDERVDIWAVGATLFTLLSGGTVTRPAHSIATVASDLPSALVDVVDRALKFDPAHRWESARIMRNALGEASRQYFGAPPGPAVLASLVEPESSRVEKGVASTASVSVPAPAKMPRTLPVTAGLVAGTIAPTAHSQQPPSSIRPRTGVRPVWLAGAAALLAAGWFVALPATPRPAKSAAAAVATVAVSDETAPYEAPVPRGETPSAAAGGGAVPRSCAEARRAGVTSDGPLRIDPDGAGPLRPFEVFCARMAEGAPREYLPLAHREGVGEPDANATKYVWAGGACRCPDLVRRFDRVRLDPGSMTIDPRDGTFATYDRPLLCEAQHRSHCGDAIDLAWGAPGSCRAAGDTSGSASIDLRGTPFALAPGVRFVAAGFAAAGSATVSKDRKVATLVGGGLCGSMVPEEPTIAVVQER
jgi:hypothetical protein